MILLFLLLCFFTPHRSYVLLYFIPWVSFLIYFCVLTGNSRLARLFPVFQYLLISSIFAEYTNWFICVEQLRQNRRIPIDQSNEDDRTWRSSLTNIDTHISFLASFFSYFLSRMFRSKDRLGFQKKVTNYIERLKFMITH